MASVEYWKLCQKRRSERRNRILTVLRNSPSARKRILEAYHSRKSALIYLTNTAVGPNTVPTECRSVQIAGSKSAAHLVNETYGRTADQRGPLRPTAGSNSMPAMVAARATPDIEIVDITDDPDPDCVIVEEHLNHQQDSPMRNVQESGTVVPVQLQSACDAPELELQCCTQNSHNELEDVANSMIATIAEMRSTLQHAIRRLTVP